MEPLSMLRQAFSEQCSGTVYHYTSAEGVAGIISNHEIWMSNTAFMNDTSELRMLHNNQSIFRKTDFTNEYMGRAWRGMLKQWPLDTNYYMASFSREKDQLEQWRAYGSFCIGFNVRKLCQKEGISLYNCLYKTNDIRGWVLNHDKNKEKWNQLRKKTYKEIFAFSVLYIASLKYKNEHFKREKEVRLITVSHHNWPLENKSKIYEEDLPIHVRRHPVYGFPVPYLKFFIEQSTFDNERVKEKEMEMKVRKLRDENAKGRKLLPITEVIVGPIAYQKEAMSACEILLADRGYKNVRVSPSRIPYRGL